MLVTAIEARPLRSLDRVRVELEPGDRQRRRPQRGRQDEPRRGALLRPHRPLLPDLRPARPDSLRRLDWRGPRRRSATRTGSSTGCSPRSAAARAAATCSTAARPIRRRSPAHRPPVAVFAPDRLTLVKGPPAERRAHLDGFVAARWPARAELRKRFGQALAQRNALLSRLAAGSAAPPSSTSGTAAWPRAAAPLVAARAEAVAELAGPFAAAADRARPGGGGALEYAPRAAGSRGGDPRRPGGAARGGHPPRPQLLGPAPRRAEARRARASRCGASARRASSGRRCWPCSSPSARCCWRPAGVVPLAAARRRDERARPRPPRAPGRPARRRRPGADHRRRRRVGSGGGAEDGGADAAQRSTEGAAA